MNSPDKGITIAEVAGSLGVTNGTVSMALKENLRFSVAMRKSTAG